jgi:hypothetical protein
MAGPKYGDVVTAVNSDFSAGWLYYLLKEWAGNGLYNAEMFIPIQSDSQEMELKSQLDTEDAV